MTPLRPFDRDTRENLERGPGAWIPMTTVPRHAGRFSRNRMKAALHARRNALCITCNLPRFSISHTSPPSGGRFRSPSSSSALVFLGVSTDTPPATRLCVLDGDRNRSASRDTMSQDSLPGSPHISGRPRNFHEPPAKPYEECGLAHRLLAVSLRQPARLGVFPVEEHVEVEVASRPQIGPAGRRGRTLCFPVEACIEDHLGDCLGPHGSAVRS